MATYKSEHNFRLTRSLTSLFSYQYRIKNKTFNTKNCWKVCRNYYKEHFTYFICSGGFVTVMLGRWKQPFYNPWHGHSSVLRLHCFYESLALSPCLAHTHTHTQNNNNNKAVSTISFLTRYRIWWQSFFVSWCVDNTSLVVWPLFGKYLQTLYKVFPCACVCSCVCVCVRAPLPLSLVYSIRWLDNRNNELKYMHRCLCLLCSL